MELFGFSTEQERRCFRMLIGVSGVGPRVALAILSDSAPDRLMLSIAAGDAKALTRAQGVGAKLAQRIILELRDKVSDEDISIPPWRKPSTIPLKARPSVRWWRWATARPMPPPLSPPWRIRWLWMS